MSNRDDLVQPKVTRSKMGRPLPGSWRSTFGLDPHWSPWPAHFTAESCLKMVHEPTQIHGLLCEPCSALLPGCGPTQLTVWTQL